MEKYILNRRPLQLIKNKEYVLDIPANIPPFSEFTIECPDLKDFTTEFGSNVSFRLNFIKKDKKVFHEIPLKEGYNLLDFKNEDAIDSSNYLLISCISNETINLALTIKESDK